MIELIFVDDEPTLFQPNTNEIPRRSKRVIQPGERLIIRHRALRRREHLIKLVQPHSQRRSEPLLFQAHHLLDELSMRLELRISFLHQIDDEVRHLIEERTLEPERVMTLVDRAAHEDRKSTRLNSSHGY